MCLIIVRRSTHAPKRFPGVIFSQANWASSRGWQTFDRYEVNQWSGVPSIIWTCVSIVIIHIYPLSLFLKIYLLLVIATLTFNLVCAKILTFCFLTKRKNIEEKRKGEKQREREREREGRAGRKRGRERDRKKEKVKAKCEQKKDIETAVVLKFFRTFGLFD